VLDPAVQLRKSLCRTDLANGTVGKVADEELGSERDVEDDRN